ncbi:hypothetical protein [Natrinema limicola]|uniref:Uncharacterized protein n=1 Tax=Natrinema limicola JCM 13563 TaxID=1230457 RepID=M0CPE2_9EURY|nr:hypothetical protein [Natrinema limicola]ELZ25130.1 hypothetical protein C476_01782 [Natrinema limicola JCM 13563]
MDVTAGSTARSRAISALILGYFVVLVYATIANDPLAAAVAEVGFGVIAIAVGTMLYDGATDWRSAQTVAAVCLVAGGLLAFGSVLTGMAAIDLLSSVLVVLGVGSYIYAVWSAT